MKIKTSEVTEAKKLGYKGDAYVGVLTGQGMNLVFNLAVSDGYESEPVREKVLKDFLEEHAGLKCKPSFAIVSVPPEIPFDDEDLSHPLIARFLSLSEPISKVLDSHPDAASEVSQSTTAVRALLQDAEFDQASPLIDALEKRLHELLATGSVDDSSPTTKTPTTATPTSETTVDPLKQKLLEALNKLVPQIKQAVASYPERKAELLKPVAEVKQQLEADDLQAAKAGILGLGAILKSIASPTISPSTTDPLRAEYETKLATVQPLYDQALQQSLGDTSKFRTVMAYVLEQSEAGAYANSIKALDRLQGALELVINTSIASDEDEADEGDNEEDWEDEESQSAVSYFKLGKARIEWHGARLVAMRELQRLRSLLLEEYEEDLDAKAALEATFSHLDSIIQTLNEELGERLDEILNASPAERIEMLPTAQEVLERFSTFVEKDETLKLIDGNEYAPDMMVARPLKEKLDAIADALGVKA